MTALPSVFTLILIYITVLLSYTVVVLIID